MMRTVPKEKLYGYAFKTILSLILLFCLYNVACILFLSPYSSRKQQSRVSSGVNGVQSIIKLAGPKKSENIIYKSNLAIKNNDSSWAKQIKRPTLFTGPTTIMMVKEEEQVAVVQYEDADATENTEIFLKGVIDGLAFISVKKEIEGRWHEHGFATKAGEEIGKIKVVGGKMLDFSTNCLLQEIVYNAHRPTTLTRKVLILDEEGEFAGTRMVPGETYMKSTSMIKYKDENGNVNELWLNESDTIIRVEEEGLSINMDEKRDL
ncbi:ABC-type nitrate/sulfonate/bicarbonate transport system, ATPase component [Candidatus Scalindua japonica]|uniref:ABC-type nitrate/sulfonate/bicarbonate transport system, ATPase component n=1 Tax=Candidatus Scalindua japonica TaxID=1284222 RepID=A0A286TZU4_9BACT|nr:hypothetical protein [Candidatus Scalindua japonica]GAX61410.1 ABC-type nitrate/sulfonate/bicarbonate transport system, ATPase component [Candidatus Scalindua japonica]